MVHSKVVLIDPYGQDETGSGACWVGAPGTAEWPSDEDVVEGDRLQIAALDDGA
jgi:hypothetical protein